MKIVKTSLTHEARVVLYLIYLQRDFEPLDLNLPVRKLTRVLKLSETKIQAEQSKLNTISSSNTRIAHKPN